METEGLKSVVDVLQTINLGSIFLLLFGVLSLIFSVRFLEALSHRLQSTFPNKRLLILQIETILSFMIYIGGSIGLFFVVLKPTNEMMFAAAGSAAVAFGFAIKDVVGSFVAGLILLFDRPFQVGDRVSFQGVYGEISSIGLRAVRLVTLDDNLVTIPNSKFITEYVSSGNAGALDMMVETSFHVALDEDIEKIRKNIYEVVCTSRFAYLSKPVIITVEEADIAARLALKIRVKAYVLDVKYEKSFQTDIVTRVSKIFRESGVQRPLRN